MHGYGNSQSLLIFAECEQIVHTYFADNQQIRHTFAE
jgi:hypothetical protein